MKHLFIRAALVVSSVAVALPLSVSAATPQQLLNQALKAQFENPRPMTVDGRLQISGSTVLLKDRSVTDRGSASIRFLSRSIPSSQPKKLNSEGQVIIEKAELFEKKESFTLPQPFGFEWKKIDKELFFRVKDLPNEWVKELPEEAMQFLNNWLRFSLSETDAQQLLQTMTPYSSQDALLRSSLSGKISPSDMILLNKLKNMSILLVTRVEKQSVVDGKQMLRLRVMVNPALISLIQTEELKGLRGLSGDYRATRTKELNKRYTEIRTALRRLHMAINLNATNSMITRFEMGGNFVEPRQTCSWNARLKKSVCSTTSRTSIQLSSGFTFTPSKLYPVEVPTSSIDFMKVLQEAFMPKAAPATVEPVPATN